MIFCGSFSDNLLSHLSLSPVREYILFIVGCPRPVSMHAAGMQDGGGLEGGGGGGEAVNKVNCGQENDEKWGHFCMLVN